MGNASYLSGIPEQHRALIGELSERACDELVREINPSAIAHVLQRIVATTALDLRMSLGIGPFDLQFHEGKHSLATPAVIHYPLVPDYHDAFKGLSLLQSTPSLHVDTSGLDGDPCRIFLPDHMKDVVAQLHRTYGPTVRTVGNLMNEWLVRNYPSDEHAYDGSLAELRHLPSAKHNDCKTRAEAQNTDPLYSFIGFSAWSKLTANSRTLEESIRAFEHLLIQSVEIRHRLLLTLQSFRVLPHAIFAEHLALQGYRTFLAFDEVTDDDVHQQLLKNVLAQAAIRKAECDNNQVMPERDDLNGDDPQILRYLDDDDMALWKRAKTFLRENSPGTRRKLTEVLDVERSKKDVAFLEVTAQWSSLGAKEREIASKVFCEVSKFPYVDAGEYGMDAIIHAYHLGTPVFAHESRSLNCFSGLWLMAALCIESGINYGQIFYCNSNESNRGEPAASHGALLIAHSDGSFSFLDFGYRRCGRSFSLDMIPDKKERNKLEKLIDESYVYSRHDSSGVTRKIYTDPVRVRVTNEIADTLRIYRHMHVAPLDQGFVGTTLLHTGISFENEGRNEEALQAYEMGLASFPNQPDLLCRCASLAIEKGEFTRAKDFLDLALSECDTHLLSLYYRGVLALKLDQDDEAEQYFARLHEDTRAVLGDNQFKDLVRDFVECRRRCRLNG